MDFLPDAAVFAPYAYEKGCRSCRAGNLPFELFREVFISLSLPEMLF